MRDILLLGANRTPIGSLGGQFSGTSVAELGSATARAAFQRAGIAPDQIDEAIFGNVLQAGQGQNPARQISLGSDVPVSVPAFTVNKVCGSGMKSLDLAWQAIQLGRANTILAGGAENMTQAPYLLPTLRGGARLGDTTAVDSLTSDGLTDVFNKFHMGITAENIADQYGITREEQDAFAADSQRKAGEAIAAGRFKDELSIVTVKQRKKELLIETDEYPRPETTAEKLAALSPAFKKDGSVTAGNASGINDGAASMIVAASDALPAGANLDRAVYLRDVRSHGCCPKTMGLGPIGAVQRLLEKNGLTVADIELWELNEAFAVQSLAVVRDLAIDPALVNVNGGAIALGHPIGCSGARIVTTLIHEMHRRGARYGVAAMCIGGGMGIGCLLERK
jgi:acetyl-CoA C-acetyltransferase